MRSSMATGVTDLYLPYFNLKSHPFTITSDPAFIFFSRCHQEALDHLQYGIDNRLGFIEITGEIGCGKTTLCRALLNRLGPDTKTAYIFNSNLTETELMQTILSDLGLDPSHRKRYDLLSELNHYLIEQLALGNNVVAIIDESQNLSIPLLEQIRMLSNLETEKEKLLQIVLVGQPELRDRLNLPELKQLRQRIAIRYHLVPLSAEEVKKYIHHRLLIAGANGTTPSFGEDALEAIYDYSRGVPRLINIVCDKALLLLFAREETHATADMVKECIDEIEGVVI